MRLWLYAVKAFCLTPVALSEMRIGSMLKEIPKATTNHKKQDLENVHEDNFLKPKSEVVQEIGFTPKQVSQFQRMAEHEDVNSQNENPACTGKRDSHRQQKEGDITRKNQTSTL